MDLERLEGKTTPFNQCCYLENVFFDNQPQIQLPEAEAALRGKRLGGNMTHPILPVKFQGPGERRSNNNKLSVGVLDPITTPRDQGEALEEGERVDEVENPCEWEAAILQIEGFEHG